MKIVVNFIVFLKSPKSFWWLIVAMLAALMVLEISRYLSGREIAKKSALDSGQTVIYSLKTGEIEGLPEVMHGADKKAAAISDNAETPPALWKDYARAFSNPEGKPVVAIIINGLGMSRVSTEDALNLPPEITLSFSPYSHDVEGWIEKAVANGREIYMDLPMEPDDYPMSDPGIQGLISAQDEGENIKRLLTVIDRYTRRVGLVSPVEEKFTSSAEALRPVLSFMYQRGVLFVRGKVGDDAIFRDIATGLKMPVLEASMEIDSVISSTDINVALDKLVEQAKQNKFAIGIAKPYPVTMREIRKWVKDLDKKGVLLAPVSAVALMSEEAPAQEADHKPVESNVSE